jgi:hypothetical protein
MDTYLTIAGMAKDWPLTSRVAACAAQQGVADPETWAVTNGYAWAAAPGWAGKWDSAVLNGVENPGADPSVISDADILAVVQLMVAG